MPIDSIQKYQKALGLLDNPDVDDETRDSLESGIAYFKQANPYAVVKASEKASPANAAKARQMEFEGHRLEPTRMLSSMEALEKSGFQNPGTDEEYGQKMELVEDENRRRATLEKTGRDPGEVLHPDTFNEMMSGIIGYDEKHPEAYADYAERRDATVASEQKKLAEADKNKPIWERGFEETSTGQKLADEEPRGDMDGEVLPNASNVRRLYSAPEYVPTGVGFADMVNMKTWLEPSLAMARAATGDPTLQTTDDKYKRFSDAMWQEEVEKAKAEKRPVRRASYAATKDWFDRTIKFIDEKVSPPVGAAAAGIDDSLAWGAVGRASGTRGSIEDVVEEHPYAYGTGAVIGALAPGGLTSRIYSAITKKAGGKALGRLAGGTASAALGQGGTDVVTNLSETPVGPGAPGKRVSGEDMLKRMGIAGVAGAGGSALGELIAAGGGAIARGMRKGELGQDFVNIEQAGMTTQPRLLLRDAVSKSPEIQAAEKVAAESGGGMRVEDVLSRKVHGPVARQRLHDTAEGAKRSGLENERFANAVEGTIPRRMEETRMQIEDEIARLHGRDGRPMGGQEGTIRDLKRVLDWFQYPAVEGGRKAFNVSRPTKEMNFRELENAIKKIGDKARQFEKAEKSTEAGIYNRILKSAMGSRRKFPKADEPDLFKDDEVLKGAAAMKGRHELDYNADVAKNRALGLPEKLEPKVSLAPPGEKPLPKLTFDEDRALDNAIQNYRSAKGQKAQNDALAEAVDAYDPTGALRAELNQNPALRSRQKIIEKGQLRSFLGMGGNVSAYSSKPLQTMGLWADPYARGLSKLPPEAASAGQISDELRFLLKRLTGNVSKVNPRSPSRSLDPIHDIGRARGRFSAHRLGPAAGGAARSYNKDEPLSPAEVEMLKRLYALSQRKQLKAGGQ